MQQQQQQETTAAAPTPPSAPPSTPLPPCCAALPPGFPHPGIPAVVVDTRGAPLPADKTRVPADLCTCGAPGGKDYSVPATVRIRGSSSAQEQAQKSLAVDSKRRGNESREADIEFMGEWVG